MPFREDVPIADFIQSNPFLNHAFGASGQAATFTFAPPSPDAVIYPNPSQTRTGVLTRSTENALVPWPAVVWDVNGYYHALGVGFNATRKQLMRGYNARDGQSSDYLTYVFAQLLDEAVRRSYDACPLGTKFFDRYIEEEIRRRAVEQASRRGMEAEDVLEEWGFIVEREGGEDDLIVPGVVEEDEVDIPQEEGEDSPVTPEQEPWPYTYFAWRLKRREDRLENVEIMRRWQEAIVAECQARKISLQFAVGIMGEKQGSRIMTMSVSGATVVFIATNAVEMMQELAPLAVVRLTQHRD